MTAVDFVLYCLGVSMLPVAAATSVRIMWGIRGPVRKRDQVPPPRMEGDPFPVSDELTDRLKAFQAQRFASPIVQRQLGPSAGPPVRVPPAVARERQEAAQASAKITSIIEKKSTKEK